MPTGAPHALTIGATTSVVLSPTPPVECLSTVVPETAVLRSSLSPESVMASVRSVVSREFMPRK